VVYDALAHHGSRLSITCIFEREALGTAREASSRPYDASMKAVEGRTLTGPLPSGMASSTAAGPRAVKMPIDATERMEANRCAL
jgi:hypothetical protein